MKSLVSVLAVSLLMSACGGSGGGGNDPVAKSVDEPIKVFNQKVTGTEQLELLVKISEASKNKANLKEKIEDMSEGQKEVIGNCVLTVRSESPKEGEDVLYRSIDGEGCATFYYVVETSKYDFDKKGEGEQAEVKLKAIVSTQEREFRYQASAEDSEYTVVAEKTSSTYVSDLSDLNDKSYIPHKSKARMSGQAQLKNGISYSTDFMFSLESSQKGEFVEIMEASFVGAGLNITIKKVLSGNGESNTFLLNGHEPTAEQLELMEQVY